MKNLSKLVMLVAVVVFAASCGSADQNSAASAINIDQESVNKGQRAAESGVQSLSEVKTFTLNGQELNFTAADIMSASSNANAQAAAAEDANNLMNALMGADKEAQTLDVTFSMADEPVENGMFVFGIETENAKGLTMQMFDEEGFGMVANNQFDVNQGNNYKALNVNALSSGSYIFRLKDADGKELQRTVEVANK